MVVEEVGWWEGGDLLMFTGRDARTHCGCDLHMVCHATKRRHPCIPAAPSRTCHPGYQSIYMERNHHL